MLVRAEQYEIMAECKTLAHDRGQFKRFSKFDGPYKALWTFILSAFHVILILFLNFIGIGYFICCIFLFKCGYIVMTNKSRRVWHKRKNKQTYHAYSTVLNLEKRLQYQPIKFDTDSTTVICNNSANVHICNDKNMFISPPCWNDQNYITTIGDAKNSAAGMGTTRWSWKDYVEKQDKIDVQNILCFPQSPVNILSITSLADQINNDNGTGINTKRSKSHFY